MVDVICGVGFAAVVVTSDGVVGSNVVVTSNCVVDFNDVVL